MFEKISLLGKVKIERVLFAFENEPIIFVCKNKGGTRYICVNTGYGFSPSWLVAQSSKKTIIKMLKDEISILDAVAESNRSIIVVHQDGEDMSFERMPFDAIDPDELPDKHEKLHNGGIADYIQQLENEEIRKNYKNTLRKYNFKTVLNIPERINTDIDRFGKLKESKKMVEYIEG